MRAASAHALQITPADSGPPQAELHIARLVYAAYGCAGSRGYCNPWWAIDYPAEIHFAAAVERMTEVEVAPDSRHVQLMDEQLYDYPWLLLQQPARGDWHPRGVERDRLEEYLLRGGFLVVDDFHGEYEWAAFEAAILDVLPGRVIVPVRCCSMRLLNSNTDDSRSRKPLAIVSTLRT